MRIIARFKKAEQVRFISHLDIQRTFQRAFIRAGLPISYSAGFNPHQLLSFATALTVGHTSEAEWLDVHLDAEIPSDEFIVRVNAVLPDGLAIIEAVVANAAHPSLTAVLCAASYIVTISLEEQLDKAYFETALHELLSAPIIISKHTKNGFKDVNIWHMIYTCDIIEYKLYKENTQITVAITGQLSPDGSLNIDMLMDAFSKKLGKVIVWDVNRKTLFSDLSPLMPAYK